MRFRFIDAERAGLAMPIFRLCRLLQVSVSGFYAWRNRGPSQRQLDDMVLLAHVRAAFRRSRESYGAERVHHELAENGIEVGRHRVARLMRGNGLSPKRKQKFKKTTDSQHNKAVASNLLDQNFSAEAPNEKWAADISYIWTAQGWLYLAVMLDLYSRRVIGWAVGARMTSDLPLRALNRAIGLRQPGAGVIHHSDRGSQYCSDAYQARLGELGFLASMSGKGNCYDNAVVETFFKTIKSELIWRTVFMSRSQAETAVAGYIDGFYNPVRRHSTLDFQAPSNSSQKCKRCRAPPLFLDGQLATGLGEGQVAEFVEDDEVASDELVRGTALASGAEFGLEVVDQVDDVVAAATGALSDTGAGDGDGEMGLSGAGAADQHDVALALQEVAAGEFLDQGLIDRGSGDIEIGQLLGRRQLGGRHLVLDGARLLVGDLGLQQRTDDLLQRMTALEPVGEDVIVGGAHACKLQRRHHRQHIMTLHDRPPSGGRSGGSRPPAGGEAAGPRALGWPAAVAAGGGGRGC